MPVAIPVSVLKAVDFTAGTIALCGMAGVRQLLKQTQRIQKKMQDLQEELAQREIEVSSGGAVTVRITLSQEVKAIKIDPELLKEDVDLVEETILNAVKEAVDKSKADNEAEMAKVTDGLNLPGLM